MGLAQDGEEGEAPAGPGDTEEAGPSWRWRRGPGATRSWPLPNGDKAGGASIQRRRRTAVLSDGEAEEARSGEGRPDPGVGSPFPTPERGEELWQRSWRRDPQTAAARFPAGRREIRGRRRGEKEKKAEGGGSGPGVEVADG